MTEHIQINDVAPRISYVADGVQSAFTFPFAIFKAADLEVWLGEERQAATYTVSGAGVSTGGTVLFAVPPVQGARVTLRRRLGLARLSDYQADGIIRAKTLNDELDYQVAALQQLAEDVGRAVKRSPTSASLADLTLPEPAPQRGLKWNDQGTALVNTTHDPDTLGDAVQAASDATAAAAIATTARDQAIASVGAVKVSVNDTVAATLAAKLVAGTGICVTELNDGGDERLSIASTGDVPAITQRLDFLERNLAVTVLRDQIDTGWSVLKMVDGVADEFEDELGIASKTGATYDTAGDYFHNPPSAAAASPYTGADVVTGTFAAGGTTYSTDVPAHSYDGSTNTYWVLTNASGAVVTFGWLLGNGLRLAKIEVWGRPNFPVVNATVMVSADTTTGADGTWTTVTTGWSPTAGQYGALTIPGGIYKGLKIVSATTYASPPAGYYSAINDIRFYGATPSPNMTLVSATSAATGFSVIAPPVEARLALLHQPVDTVALNADVVVEASRDGGTTWTSGTLTSEAGFDATTNVLAAVVGLAAQPAGASMKWRVRTLNAKEQRLHGVWMQWR